MTATLPDPIASLFDFDVTIPLTADGNLRTVRLRIPAVDAETAAAAAEEIAYATAELGSPNVWHVDYDKIVVAPIGRPVHPATTDRWMRRTTVPGLTVAVDRGGCIVLHHPGGTVTVTDLNALISDLQTAQTMQHVMVEQQSQR
jgi:hypothetical protein